MPKREPVFCKVCNQQTKYIPDNFTRYHLKKEHNINTIKEYYDEYIKKPDEGLCKLCGKPTTFQRLNIGYREFCSNRCQLEHHNFIKDQEWRSRVKYTYLQRYGTIHPMKNQKCKDKRKQTCLDNNGCEYPAQNPVILDKIKQTNIKKYGVDNPSKSQEILDKIRQTNESSGLWISLDQLSNYERYYHDVFIMTKKSKKELYDNWNGLCFYTKERLITNLQFKKIDERHTSYNMLQPTIDHKISVSYGFKNNIDPKLISDISNLCICSKLYNCQKNRDIYLDDCKIEI